MRLLIAILICCIGLSVVMGAVLTEYATITETVTVHQAVVFCDNSTEKQLTKDVVSGTTVVDCFCLKNRAEVPANATFQTLSDNVTTEYWRLLNISDRRSIDDGVKANITVESAKYVRWTIDVDNPSNTTAYRLIIAGDTIKYQIHSNNGDDLNYTWGTHLYSPYGPVDHKTGWHTTWNNIPVSEINGINATNRTIGNNTVFTITIDMQYLPIGTVKWAVILYKDNCTYTIYPDNYRYIDKTPDNMTETKIADRMDNFTIDSDSTVNFAVVNKFPVFLEPGKYTIVSKIVPKP